jgi:hypothetical protein
MNLSPQSIDKISHKLKKKRENIQRHAHTSNIFVQAYIMNIFSPFLIG